MLIKSIPLLLLILSITSNLFSQTIIIPEESTWNYLDDGSNQGNEWSEVNFNDSSWKQNFPAKFGYGENQATTISYGSESSNKHITTYFRKSFNVADPTQFDSLILEAIRDDGMVVYLNGVLVWSDNMPESFDSITYASSGIGGDEESQWISKSIESNLVTGTNVIAVEIHQATASSSDLSFDFRVVGYSKYIISEGSTWNYLDDGSNQGNNWYSNNFNDSSWTQNSPAKFGYGDGQTTTISYGSNYADKHVTTYFRKSFNITDSSQYDNLILEAVRDDGMVVYINGVQVWSNNMPESFDFSTHASSGIGGDSEDEWISQEIESNLVTGINTIAVEIHQATASSSDLSFDFRVSGYQNYSLTEGSTWNYLDDGSNQGSEWYGVDFNDSSWKQNSPAKFGYGDDQITTVSYGAESSNKHITTYFRKSFFVADNSLFDYLILEAIRDDGMVVYINGVQVWSNNMPESFDFSTHASSGIGGDDEDEWILQEIESNLVTGNNIIAVEIHQATASSSDLSFDFRISGSNSTKNRSIIRGPYLQKGTSTSIVIKWRTEYETVSTVNYGTSLGELNRTKQDNTPKTDHEITIDGLNPNTKYYYEITNLDYPNVIQDSNMFFKTAPEIGTKQFVRAWILGDPGTGNTNQRNVRDQYYNYVNTAATNPDQTDMMLFLGDNAYQDGTDEEYQTRMFDIYSDMLKKSVAWSTMGNHDAGSASSTTQSGVYYDIFNFPTEGEVGGVPSNTEAYYSFDYGNIHFIVLDSHELYNDSTQMSWCLSDIQETTQDWIVALFHHPIYSKGSHDTDNTSEYRSFEMRENFQPILEENGVDLILNGHSHAYERSYFVNGHYDTSDTFDSDIHTVGENGNLSGREDTSDGAYTKAITDTKGAVYITNGSAGHNTGGELNHNAMHTSLDQLGSCVLETSSDGTSNQNLTIKFLNDTGDINDYFTIKKSTRSSKNNDTEATGNSVIVYPVPSHSLIKVKLANSESLKKLKLYSIIGELIKESTDPEININNIIPGNYMIEVSTDRTKTYHKIIITK